MQSGNALIARALEIAPDCATNKVIRTRLKHEGFSIRDIDAFFHGKALRHQLKALRQTDMERRANFGGPRPDPTPVEQGIVWTD
jgi:hypothetical protein